MPLVTLDPERSVLIVVDLQPSFTRAIHEGDRVLSRAAFLAGVARLLEVPVLASEQNPERMGGTDPQIASLLSNPAPYAKMAFSCAGCSDMMLSLEATGRRQAVIMGIETHICVSQTAHGLLQGGFEVVVCPDAVSARTLDRHKLGMERLRDAGAVPAHTESVAYEWLGSADHPRFREALALVKAAP